MFRTAGIYVGSCWILVEGASVILPAFGASDWVLRLFIIAALAGFPVTIVLAWIFDITDKGIVIQDDASQSPTGVAASRRMDFVAIAILSVALAISLYLNVKRDPVPPANVVQVEPALSGPL